MHAKSDSASFFLQSDLQHRFEVFSETVTLLTLVIVEVIEDVAATLTRSFISEERLKTGMLDIVFVRRTLSTSASQFFRRHKQYLHK